MRRLPVNFLSSRNISIKTIAIAAVALGGVCPVSVFAQKFDVKIVDRQDNETGYTYVVPSHFTSQSDSYVNCNGNDSSVNCNGSTTTNGTVAPPRTISYQVRGATFTLLLPDGRAAVDPLQFSLVTVKLSLNVIHQRRATTPSINVVTFRSVFAFAVD